ATAATLGGRLTILGAGIEHRGDIDMPAGILQLGARGASGDVVLSAGSEIHAQGVVHDFAGDAVAASGGAVTLASDHGRIAVETGALLDVSGGTGSGDAGQLALLAPSSVVRLDGELRGAAAAGFKSGSATVDVASLPDFASLDGKLSLAGFNESRDLRVRNGDVSLAGNGAASGFKPVAHTRS